MMYVFMLLVNVFVLSSPLAFAMHRVEEYAQMPYPVADSVGNGLLLVEGESEVVEYQESALRRFDILFFLSLPVLVLYHVVAHQLLANYANMSGGKSIRVHQIVHIAVSSVVLASGVAYDGVRVVKSPLEPIPVTARARVPAFSVAWEFLF